MACSECVNIVCKDLYISPCDTGIDTGISVYTGGDYTALIDFNGTAQRISLVVTADENIVLENILNLNYVHEFRLYDSANVLVGDNCYRFHTHLVSGTGNNIIPTPQEGHKMFITVTVDGDTFTHPFFALYTINEIDTDNQAYLRDVGFTQSGATITALSFGFYIGQIIYAKA